MSRIDEALQRISSKTGEARTVYKPGDRPARRDEHLLEHYPQEPNVGSRRREWPQDEPSDWQDANGHSGQLADYAPAVSPVLTKPVLAPVAPAAFEVPEGSGLVGPAAQGVHVEQYRRVAASLHELQAERGLRTLMVTSAVPREGKTLTIVNVALTLANSYGRRVLLVDADLRRPTIHEVLRLKNSAGLNELLVKGHSNLPVVRVSPMLDVLPAGRPTNDPFKALTSDRMHALLEEASSLYDWVLLDAPPVGLMPDAALLAGLSGATLLVVAAGSTPYKLVERVVSEIGRERIVGTVLNRIEDRHIPATGYYHSYYGVSK